MIFRYAKSENFIFNLQYKPYKDFTLQKLYLTGLINLQTLKDKELLERGKELEDWWDDIYTVDRVRSEMVGYATQKPTALLKELLASSNPDSIVADFLQVQEQQVQLQKDLVENGLCLI